MYLEHESGKIRAVRGCHSLWSSTLLLRFLSSLPDESHGSCFTFCNYLGYGSYELRKQNSVRRLLLRGVHFGFFSTWIFSHDMRLGANLFSSLHNRPYRQRIRAFTPNTVAVFLWSKYAVSSFRIRLNWSVLRFAWICVRACIAGSLHNSATCI